MYQFPRPGHDIVDWINAGSTLVIAAFAIIQVFMMRAEKRHRLGAAFAALWIEYWRLQTTALAWNAEDLVHMAERGLLQPGAIEPEERSAVAQLLGEFGMQTTRFGGVAYATAANAAAKARELVNLVSMRTSEKGAAGPLASKSKRFRPEYWRAGVLLQVEKDLKRLAKDSAAAMEDATKCTPHWLQRETLKLDGLESPFAAQLRTFAEAEEAVREALPWRKRTWLWIKERAAYFSGRV